MKQQKKAVVIQAQGPKDAKQEAVGETLWANWTEVVEGVRVNARLALNATVHRAKDLVDALKSEKDAGIRQDIILAGGFVKHATVCKACGNPSGFMYNLHRDEKAIYKMGLCPRCAIAKSQQTAVEKALAAILDNKGKAC